MAQLFHRFEILKIRGKHAAAHTFIIAADELPNLYLPLDFNHVYYALHCPSEMMRYRFMLGFDWGEGGFLSKSWAQKNCFLKSAVL